ncbi:MAG: EamA family transporter [Rickettsiales bacterium]|jgi:O-acetylserine/cysteine efflux transporter|nr:EamA family transporter [Rickettsiales bacterium]
MKKIDILLSVMVAVVWGSYFSASKIALNSFPHMLFVGLRFLILFLITSTYLFKDILPIKEVFYFSLIALFNMFAINKAIDLCSDLSPIILINELSVPVAVLLGVVFLKEKFYFKDIIGMVIAFIGLSIVINTRSEDKVQEAGMFFAIIASLSFALYNLYLKKLSKYNLVSIISLSSLFIFPVFIALSFFQEEWPSLDDIKLESVLSLIYVVVVISFLSMLSWMYLLRTYSMSKVVPFNLLTPVFGCIINTMVLNERIGMSTILGGVVIITGLVIIEFKKDYAAKKP